MISKKCYYGCCRTEQTSSLITCAQKTSLKSSKSSVTFARTWVQKQRNSAEGPALLRNRQYINLCKDNWTKYGISFKST